MSASIVPYEEKFLPQIRDIFFESSTKKSFKDEAERDAFFYKYLGFYLKYYPHLAWVALDDRVLGYVVSAPISSSEEIDTIQPHLKTFERYFSQYPGHLHINCHHEARGKGIGGMLVAKVIQEFKTLKIAGIHIITGPDALNKNFYKKLGFDQQAVESFQGSPILFMGKRLCGE